MYIFGGAAKSSSSRSTKSVREGQNNFPENALNSTAVHIFDGVCVCVYVRVFLRVFATCCAEWVSVHSARPVSSVVREVCAICIGSIERRAMFF